MKAFSFTLVAVLALFGTVAFAQQSFVKTAVATLTPTSGNAVSGSVVLSLVSEQFVKISANITGLAPNSFHGFHIHQYGALDAQGLASGSHYNPFNVTHACLNSTTRHVGDLGNIQADATGTAFYSELNELVKLNGPTSVIGRAFIVHLNPDDCVTQPVGNAGSRIAQGVIGILEESHV